MANLLENTTTRTIAPFRYDIVGSFLRPQAIKDAREKFADGKITQAELTQVEDSEIRRLVTKQKEIGLKSVTDGEFRRSYWHLDFFWGFDGVEHVMMEHGYLFHGEETRADSARLSGKIRFSDHPFLAHYRFLKQIAGDDVIARQTIPAPAQLFAELVRGENEKEIDKYYSDRNELYSDISTAYRKAILAFYELGCRNIQLDDCTWGMLCDKDFWSAMAGEGYDVQELQNLYLRLNNDAIADLPADLTVTTHVCRGNYHSTWATSGGYDPVAKNLLGNENVSAYYLEYDTDRSGDFSPLKEISGDKLVVLGLVTSKHGELEDKEQIIARIREAAQYVPADRLCLSPQCGFASTEEGNILTEEQQWNKLSFIKEIAEEVWG
ncbi:5-methyltetrahydropteroyltriglutamate--homocysteine S-methyltransferase [Desulforamulus aquiferis]|uniref:5-methyltetrahydropteroyltriglutamate--homocysteine S-methyltransferase n=1 Tax=Desulforamulus aquiferis TaxID=1397668 RepID=A0AAW7ZCP0_9FIRM|nr:5-methyltetrahydropteroyltriglutamate--homocysteine S-methyltransferase [Desulforamulus aquiferis]MDO7787015.1 5-methyltetrahydropteroyltriglutamate--homocysteine S-methyltransferase [Desulforamulus aquiferis]RYD03813.1 5-methyltetrahydropteroyltriglutamate--homocysteine methyltransferase [Desulforamulus aquiferis]